MSDSPRSREHGAADSRRADRHDSAADRFVDDLMPEAVEWRRLVTTYPKSALAVAAVGGFLLGRRRGSALLAAASGFVVHEVGRNVETFLAEMME